MKLKIWFLLSLFVCGITCLYAARILQPWNAYMGTLPGALKAQMWDLYPRWVGARELLVHGRNPYSSDVSHEIQMAYYGHIVTQDYDKTGHKIIDEQRFAYPLYVVFLLAPTIYADFAEVYRWAPLILGLIAALSVPLCLDILGWRLPWAGIASVTLFTVSSPQITQGMRHQQLSVVVGTLLIAGAWCVQKNHLGSAGALLAWSTIKPQMVLFPLCFFLIWVIGNWPKRWRLLAGFIATLVLLVAVGELLLPGWVDDFITGAWAYRRYFPTTSVLRMALGDTLGAILGGIILTVLLILAWRDREASATSRQFATTFAAFLIGTILAFPLFTPFNQAMLILPTLLVLQDWEALPGFFRLVFVIFVAWPWIASSLLLVFPPHLNSTNEMPLLPLLLVSFFPLFLPAAVVSRRSNARQLDQANSLQIGGN